MSPYKKKKKKSDLSKLEEFAKFNDNQHDVKFLIGLKHVWLHAFQKYEIIL